MYNLEQDGLFIYENAFDADQMKALNNLPMEPFVGNVRDKGWHNHEDVRKLEGDVDWLYHWSKTPEDNDYINNTILPTLVNICDDFFDGPWGWQDTNRYIMSNYKHDLDVQMHLDAPYLWPQRLSCQMAKMLPPGPLSLTFMIPLTDFTIENGATAYVPGTHKYIYDTAKWNEAKPVHNQFFADNYIQPEVSVGSFVSFHGGLMHSIMSNTTDTVRRGIIYRGIRQDALDEMNKLGLG